MEKFLHFSNEMLIDLIDNKEVIFIDKFLYNKHTYDNIFHWLYFLYGLFSLRNIVS